MEKEKLVLAGTEIISLCLYLKKEKVVVIGDMHLGKEEELNRHGVFVPRTNFSMIMKELKKVFKETGRVNEIILLGDIKHEFSAASNQEWREVIRLFEYLQKMGKKIVLLRGNHDNYLKPIAKWKGIEIDDVYEKGRMLFMHGDKMFPEARDKKHSLLVIGHAHPAITLKEGNKKEKYKCIAKLEWEGKNIVVLPSFSFLSEGTDFRTEKMLGPYLEGMREFECWVVEGREKFYFGKIKREAQT